MDELVRGVSSRLDVEEDVAQTAVGAILNFIKKHYVTDEGSLDFDQILEHIQGAQRILRKEEEREESIRPGGSAEAKASTTGTSTSATTTTGSNTIFGLILQVLKVFGILAMLKTFLGSIFGESATKMIESVEEGAELTAVFQELKLSREQGITILKMLWNVLQDKLDEKTVNRIKESIPAIQALLKNFKKDE